MEISNLKFLTYSMLINNIDIDDTTKKKSSFNYINLEKLALAFPLDFDYSPPNWEPYGSHPGFLSKSYYQSNPELGYNYPPKGPIGDHFICTYCKKVGSEYHSVNCKRPFESSLVLTEDGIIHFPGRLKGTSYLLISKKPGQKKIITESIKSEKFTDSVEIIYESDSFTKSVIRISRNGVINIISASDPLIGDKVINKINKSDALTPEYPDPSYIINSSYKYLILAQFNLFSGPNHLDLRSFDDFLKEYIKKNTLMFKNEKYLIEDYVFNSGEIQSRNSKPTNPYIKFNLIIRPTKINVMIYNKGAVQLRASNIKGIKQNISNEGIEEVYLFLKKIITRLISDSIETGYPVIVPDDIKIKKIGISNTIDSKEPQKCHDRAGIRPVPYSFNGKCPLPGYYVPPRGLHRNDGLVEPCCYKLKKKGKDSIERLYDILINGYPDSDAGKYGEIIPDPDTQTSVYKPGTKIKESRRRLGLKDLPRDHLIQCIEDYGYFEKKNIFTKKTDDYSIFKEKVLTDYSSLVGTKSILKQTPSILTNETFELFTQKQFLVAPIMVGTIYALLYFNSDGESYFLNINNDISKSGLPVIQKLHDTVITGYLLPYKEPEFIFYLIDIFFYTTKNLMSNEFYNGTNKDRFTGLTYALGVINKHPGILQVKLKYDLDILNGTKLYLEKYDLDGLLFVGYTSLITNKINKNIIMWNETINNLYIDLDIRKDPVKKNRWFVSIDSKNIPQDLLPQIDSSIEIPVKFTDDNKIKDSAHILFKIILNKITNKISNKKPLIPIEKIDLKINDYTDVISLLQSIQTPIKKETFLHPESFKLQSKVYTSISIDRPLVIS